MNQSPPEHLIFKLKADPEIEQIGRLEAEMTFMKKHLKKDASDVVYSYPEYVITNEQIFTFGSSYGRHLEKLERGIIKVSRQVVELFNKNGQN